VEARRLQHPRNGTLVAETGDVTYRFVLGIAVLLAGCPVGVADDQEIDASGGTDAPPATAGLTISWDCTPEVPGLVTSDLLVQEVRLQASSLRMIGDSAAPGDQRTTRAPLELDWSASGMPEDIALAAAPPGLYSRLEIGTGGSDEQLIIKGRVRLQGDWRNFEIEDQRPHAIVKNIVLALSPGDHKTIPVTVDVAVVLASVPFNDLESDDGVLEFPENDPRLDAVWAAFDTAVTLPGAFIDR
jgi:hypothetical protein